MRAIRPAVESDVSELIELARRSWLSAFAQTAPWPLIESWAVADRTSAHYQRHWREMLVLVDAGAILGLVQPVEAEINGLWVHPAHQGTGVGSRLLAAGEDVIRREGHGTAWLRCSVYNPRALAFYAKRGYVETRRVSSTHPTGLTYADVRMEHEL